MGSWWAHCIQKEGLKFDQKLKGIFWVILYEPWWARKRRLCYLWLLSGAYEPSKGFLPFLEGKSIISRKKREPCLSPHARGLMFWVLILYGVRVFEMFRFFMKTPVVVRIQTVSNSDWITLLLSLIFVSLVSLLRIWHRSIMIYQRIWGVIADILM